MNETVKPAVIDDEEFHAAAESVLREGETVADLIDRSARAEVEYRRVQADFVAKGLVGLEEAERTGVWYDADEVHAELRAKLEKKKAQLSQ
ncbi:prevent-host-death protein [Rhizobium rhizophilum]|uniref:Prevent-host-death protein n=1 Tax=Rhizobium rhizophilum TaxID=1850373 RepID=A0ABY2QWW5_9HYPH|nr:prevent-host-death protein [Rhizobium rhizophilum]THV14344.1 prevent-host-death protein [Rhizobium rhizophilum]